MTPSVLAVELERVPEGLERLLRLLRSLALPVQGLAIDSDAQVPSEVVLRIGSTPISDSRLVAEIQSLNDVVAVRMIDADERVNAHDDTSTESTTDGNV